MSNAIDEIVEDRAATRPARAEVRPAGASPAIPRDPRLLNAEAAEYAARAAAEQAEAARAAVAEAEARAAAAREAAAKSKAELEVAREEAKAKAKAAALQVRLEQEQEADRAAAARANNRARRNERLGAVEPRPEVETQVVTVTQRSTDLFSGALATFLVRAVAAGWFGIVGWQALVDQRAVIDALVKVGIPAELSNSLSWGVGIGLIVLAALLLFGVGTRVFAAVALVGVGVFLAFFRFGPFSPFLEGHFGFYGDRDVFLAALLLALVLLGAGGWSLDARFRQRRAAGREDAE